MGGVTQQISLHVPALGDQELASRPRDAVPQHPSQSHACVLSFLSQLWPWPGRTEGTATPSPGGRRAQGWTTVRGFLGLRGEDPGVVLAAPE